MNALLVISACVCAASGLPQYYQYARPGYAAVAPIVAPAPEVTYEYNVIPDTAPVPEAPAPQVYAAVAPFVPTEYKTQYHSQDELGQFAFGHASPGQAHSATRDYTGAVRGSYTYIDAEGKEVVAHYIADAGGFRISSNALPVAPTFTGEAPVAPEFNLEAPVFDLEVVKDTPEVEAAKAEHFRLVEEHKAAVAAALAQVEAEETETEAPAAEEVVEAVEEAPEETVEAAEEAPEEAAVEEAEETTEAAPEAAEETAEEETAEEETAEEETAEEETAEEETASRRKRSVILGNQVVFPEFYKAVPVEPVTVKVEATAAHPVNAPVHNAELLRVVHNPGHAVSYRVY
ncbi:ion-translocating oxidoreductase complex subunit C-like isoform X2 [Penaeus chinensis]|uniref:ion-translocating oxidoreductase complex subunit C-like isoform X2 n=1 Tax=Penaeus chinensis TaxID=139456 RepID=UPI001FB7AB8D|nr:ion-translocating oxidoreductase complex subunit C-like isoform X2 [Penaeus chinensis]